MEKTIEFVLEDGTTVIFYVLEQTTVNGVSYLLVSDVSEEEEEGEAYILKDVSQSADEEAVYQMVDEDDELDYIGRIFEELLEDIDFV